MTVARAALLDTLAALIDYPDADLPARARRCLADLAAVSPAAAVELERFAEAIAGPSLGALREQYTETFDLDPACALDVGWHLFGERHERGAFMAALRDDLRRAGVSETTELPDHLIHVLPLVGREPPDRAAALAALVAPAIERMHRALVARGSPYVHVLAAVGAVMAGVGEEDAQEVARP
jgi:nitrate reductase molybdenum cofactor assembly chaperone NarJ/NarW